MRERLERSVEEGAQESSRLTDSFLEEIPGSDQVCSGSAEERERVSWLRVGEQREE